MAVDHLDRLTFDQLLRQVRREALATLQNASIGRAGLRVYNGGWIRIENGGLSVTGTANVSGLLGVQGRLLGTGELVWSGPWELSGNGDITGNVDITGILDVLSAIRLGGSGYIEAGTVRIDRLGSYGGRVVSTGNVLLLDAGSNVIVDSQYFTARNASLTTLDVLGRIDANALEVGPGPKNFKIPHPTKDGHVLRHGSTESPVSGVEYWGEETLPESGELTVPLPSYFEALTKPENRAVLVTGRGFVADWGDIEDGTFTVTGNPGGRFSWLVKAERFWADFLVEEPGPVMRLEENP